MRVRQVAWALAGVALLATMQSASADMIIDNFEGYSAGQTIGTTSSSPWRRVGDASLSNILATDATETPIEGQRSAKYRLNWPKPSGSVRHFLAAPADWTSATAMSVKIRSDNPETHTTVRMLVGDGTTMYESRTGQTLTSDVQLLTFDISTAAMIRVTGSGNLTTLLPKVSLVGFTFKSTEGTYTETVYFDNVKVAMPEVPEPATAALGLGLALALHARSRVRDSGR